MTVVEVLPLILPRTGTDTRAALLLALVLMSIGAALLRLAPPERHP